MFTGLVEAMGAIEAAEPRDRGGLRLWIGAGALAAEPAVGDSVAVDGCCLTVVACEGARLAFDVIPETLRRTTLGQRGGGGVKGLPALGELDVGPGNARPAGGVGQRLLALDGDGL